MGIKLAGCVILYNPDKNVTENIESYIKKIDKLFIVDNGNGEKVYNELKRNYGNIEIIKHIENMGIAYSLNEVLKICQNKYTHLLTMDQDSYFIGNCMEKYCCELEKFYQENVLGLGPQLVLEDIPSHLSQNIKWNKKISVITSGNIISIKNAIAIGGFDQNLFIDEVDREFCYRGIIRGFDIFQCENGIYLKHNIGETIDRWRIHKKIKCLNHNYVRKYYIMRNRLYVYTKYRSINKKIFDKLYIKEILRLIFDVIFYENDKKRKMKSIFLGAKDFFNKNMGKKFFDY